MKAVVNQRELEAVLKSLKKLTPNIEKNVLVGATRAGAARMRDRMREKVAKRSGALAKAIYVKRARMSNKRLIMQRATIRKNVLDNGTKSKNTQQYAYYLEYGTRKMAAKPFVRPTIDGNKGEAVTAARSYFITRFAKDKKKWGF